MPSSTTSSEAPRVLLVDDSSDVRARAAIVLAAGCTVVGSVSDGAAAIEAAHTLAPEVIVLDISMPDMDGFELAKRLRTAGSQAALVFLTVYEEEEFEAVARTVGGVQYVRKSRLALDLLRAVISTRERRPFFPPED